MNKEKTLKRSNSNVKLSDKKSIKKVFNNLLTKLLDIDSYLKENPVNLPQARGRREDI